MIPIIGYFPYFWGAELKNHNRFCWFSILCFRPGGPKWPIWAKKWLFWTKMKIFIIIFIKAKFVTYLNTNNGNKPPMEHIKLMYSSVLIKMCDFYRFLLWFLVNGLKKAIWDPPVWSEILKMSKNGCGFLIQHPKNRGNSLWWVSFGGKIDLSPPLP